MDYVVVYKYEENNKEYMSSAIICMATSGMNAIDIFLETANFDGCILKDIWAYAAKE